MKKGRRVKTCYSSVIRNARFLLPAFFLFYPKVTGRKYIRNK